MSPRGGLLDTSPRSSWPFSFFESGRRRRGVTLQGAKELTTLRRP